jgi:hypothetical protein
MRMGFVTTEELKRLHKGMFEALMLEFRSNYGGFITE